MSYTFALNGNKPYLQGNFSPPIELGKGDWEIALISLNTYNSFPNLKETIVTYHEEGGINIAISQGCYDIADLEAFLNESILQARLNRKVKDNILPRARKPSEHPLIGDKFIRLHTNKNTLFTELFSRADVTFSTELSELLGFSKTKFEANITHFSERTANISNLDVVRIECGIVTGSYVNNYLSHSLFEFGINVPPGYKINIVAGTPIYLPITVSQIDHLVVRFTDQNGKLVNNRGETFTVWLHLRKVKNVPI